MKCGYGKNCKHGGEVDKDLATKVGNKYYHEDCIHEKEGKIEIEKYYLENLPPTTLPVLRKSIKQLLEKGMSVDYILYVEKYIVTNNKPINSPFGLVNYCLDYKLKNQFEKEEINKKYKELETSDENYVAEEVTFTYKPSNKNMFDII